MKNKPVSTKQVLSKIDEFKDFVIDALDDGHLENFDTARDFLASCMETFADLDQQMDEQEAEFSATRDSVSYEIEHKGSPEVQKAKEQAQKEEAERNSVSYEIKE